MTEPPNEPPLVTRPEPSAPVKPRPGFFEAVVWCLVFVAVQMFAAILAVAVAFGAYMFAAPDPGKFANEQLDAFSRAADPKAEGERPPVPREFGDSLAWGMLAAQFASLGVIAIVLPRRIGPDWKRQIGVRRPRGLHVFLVLLLVPGFMIASDLIQAGSQWATGLKPPAAMKALNSVFGEFPWALTALAVAVGPGTVEELWCRGFLGRGLCARYGIALGILFTATLFSAMHLDPSQLIVIACMGAYLHFVYMTTRSIWIPMLLHVANNGLAILFALVVKVGDAQGNVEVPVAVYLLGFSLLAFGSVALWTSRAELEPVRGAEGEPWKPESPGVSEPPEGANVRVVYATVSPAAVMFAVLSLAGLIALAYKFSR